MDKRLREDFQKMFVENEGGKEVYSYDLNRFSDELIKRVSDGAEAKLYRYSKSDYNNIRALETNKVYLSEVGKMNDIFEGLQISDDSIPDYQELKKISDIVRLKCFSEKKESLYMWGHYGDNSEGMCVEYDLSLLNTNDEIFKHIFPVVYLNKRFKGDYTLQWLIDCRKSFDYPNDKCDIGELSEINALYLVKGKEWEQESEWRIIFNIWENQERIKSNKRFSFDYIEMDCVSSVYMGYRMDEQKKMHIKEIVDRKNQYRSQEHKIALYDTYIHQTEYKICSEKIN